MQLLPLPAWQWQCQWLVLSSLPHSSNLVATRCPSQVGILSCGYPSLTTSSGVCHAGSQCVPSSGFPVSQAGQPSYPAPHPLTILRCACVRAPCRLSLFRDIIQQWIGEEGASAVAPPSKRNEVRAQQHWASLGAHMCPPLTACVQALGVGLGLLAPFRPVDHVLRVTPPLTSMAGCRCSAVCRAALTTSQYHGYPPTSIGASLFLVSAPVHSTAQLVFPPTCVCSACRVFVRKLPLSQVSPSLAVLALLRRRPRSHRLRLAGRVDELPNCDGVRRCGGWGCPWFCVASRCAG